MDLKLHRGLGVCLEVGDVVEASRALSLILYADLVTDTAALDGVIVLVEYLIVYLFLLCHVDLLLLLGADLVLAGVRSIHHGLVTYRIVLCDNGLLVDFGILFEAYGVHVWPAGVLVCL